MASHCANKSHVSFHEIRMQGAVIVRTYLHLLRQQVPPLCTLHPRLPLCCFSRVTQKAIVHLVQGRLLVVDFPFGLIRSWSQAESHFHGWGRLFPSRLVLSWGGLVCGGGGEGAQPGVGGAGCLGVECGGAGSAEGGGAGWRHVLNGVSGVDEDVKGTLVKQCGFFGRYSALIG